MCIRARGGGGRTCKIKCVDKKLVYVRVIVRVNSEARKQVCIVPRAVRAGGASGELYYPVSNSHAPNMCTANSCSSENSKKSAFFWAPPPFCNKKALLVRPRSGKNEPFRSLGCRFVDQNVALLSHTPCRRPQYCTVAHKRHAQEHRVENWSYSAAPVRAAGADQTKMAGCRKSGTYCTASASRPAAA